LAGTPTLIEQLTVMINDEDAYAREAAARTLGRIGMAAASGAVLNALTKAMEDPDANVHEAAVDSLTRLRKIRATLPLNLSSARKNPTEPLPV
ncbi:MAG: HEAT repeat domain-containing protein, partial [Oscillochloris sp.]|nr:HEAT repeat domain-containing protein [Oscillochloris sp.]